MRVYLNKKHIKHVLILLAALLVCLLLLKLVAWWDRKQGIVDIDKMKIVKVFSNYFEKYFEQYAKTGDFSLLKNDYEKYLVNCGREVRVVGSAEEIRGIATGINNDGELLLDVGDNTITIRAGEVSVRGIYGYV